MSTTRSARPECLVRASHRETGRRNAAVQSLVALSPVSLSPGRFGPSRLSRHSFSSAGVGRVFCPATEYHSTSTSTAPQCPPRVSMQGRKSDGVHQTAFVLRAGEPRRIRSSIRGPLPRMTSCISHASTVRNERQQIQSVWYRRDSTGSQLRL